jgi:hypothetical protein
LTVAPASVGGFTERARHEGNAPLRRAQQRRQRGTRCAGVSSRASRSDMIRFVLRCIDGDRYNLDQR